MNVWDFGRRVRPADLRAGTVIADGEGRRSRITAVNPHPLGLPVYDKVQLTPVDQLAGYAKPQEDWGCSGAYLLNPGYDTDDDYPPIPLPPPPWVVVSPDRGADLDTGDWFERHVMPALTDEARTPTRRVWLGPDDTTPRG